MSSPDFSINTAVIDLLRTMELDKFDADGNGTISLEEFKAYAKDMSPEEQAELFENMPKNENGEVSYSDVIDAVHG